MIMYISIVKLYDTNKKNSVHFNEQTLLCIIFPLAKVVIRY